MTVSHRWVSFSNLGGTDGKGKQSKTDSPTESDSSAADKVDSSDKPDGKAKVSFSKAVEKQSPDTTASDVEPVKEKKTQIDPTKMYDASPMRATGKWSVEEVTDPERQTVEFRAIDDIETDLMETAEGRANALVPVTDEEQWKNKLMFVYKFSKTPKHLTWKELGQEIECLDCVIDLDDHRPEEVFTMRFFFINRSTGYRDEIWRATNDVSNSEAFTDLLAAVGSCLGRADVHRTIRFDDGLGTTRDINFRKKSRYTSEIQVAFRPAVKGNLYEQIEANNEWEREMQEQGLSTWGYHPTLMDPEYRDTDDPEGTYHLSLSAHALSFVVNRAIHRLVTKPMKEFYRPSQVQRTMRTKTKEDLGVVQAIKGWVGIDPQIFPHYTPLEAIQENWLGADAPFTLIAITNKLREMTYLKPQNAEFQSWLSVRERESAVAMRNVKAKLLGAGASPLFAPLSHNATVNQLLPKPQRRNVKTQVSLGGMIGMPDETRKLDELRKITGINKLTGDSTSDTSATARTTTSGSDGKESSPIADAKKATEGSSQK